MTGKMSSIYRKLTFVLLLVLMLTASLASIRPIDKDVEVIVIVKGEPLIAVVSYHNRTLDEKYAKETAEDKMRELEATVKGLQEKGIPLHIEAYLYTVVLGFIALVPSRFESVLNQTGKIQMLQESRTYELNIGASAKMVNAQRAWNLKDEYGNNITGKGIKIAVVDTGVNYSLPVLGGGIGAGYKVLGGYDLVDRDRDPMDLDGHGTSVAAIIAGKDEKLIGVAPDANILAYRAVTERRETSSALIVQSIDRAVSDGADVINLSLGSEGSESVLGVAIANAVSAGVVVVAAAGNSGPSTRTIEYPSSLSNVISVGASSNINSSSLKAEFSINELNRSFDVIPLNKTTFTNGTLTGRLVYVGLAGKDDVADKDLSGTIALARRGIYYFSDKAKNVHEKGAVALIVFNNLTDNFIGALREPVSIPVASISGEDGNTILKALEQETLTATLSITLDPYQVIWFSSRGPSSPFYIKPNLVAPGYEVETAEYIGGYTTISGTSFAAPHVAGAVALIKQARPYLEPAQIMALLMDTSMPLRMGRERYPVDIQGAGLMQVYGAIASDFVVEPGSLVFHLSPMNQTREERILKIKTFSDGLSFQISDDWDGPNDISIKFKEKKLVDNTIHLRVEAELNTQKIGTFYGWINVSSGKITQRIPIKVQVNSIGITVVNRRGKQAVIKVNCPTDFLSVKALIQMPGGSNRTTYYGASAENITFPVSTEGEYWISVLVTTRARILEGFSIIVIGESLAQPTPTESSGILPGGPVVGIPSRALETAAVTLAVIILSMISYATIRSIRRKHIRPT
ncbi:MAG: S8 family serine peptidase [Nitrososphaeria archaeon]